MPARPLPVNATAAAILGLLHAGPMTGGELVAAAGERFGGFFSVTRSQVYRELPALAESGLLRLGKLGARASQQYRITAAGKRSFLAWLAGPGGVDALRSPLVLRLLHADALSDADRGKLVTTSRSAYAERLKAAQDVECDPADPYATAVAEFTVAHLEAMVALLDAIPTRAKETA
jgi:DNA-binding PadR family transcriptional regulator